MKAIKLFLTFIVILAAIVGILCLIDPNIISSSDHDNSGDTTTIAQLKQKIESNITNAPKWSLQSYQELSSELKYNKDKDLKEHDFQNLYYHLNRVSIDNIYDEMLAEFGRSDCAKNEIDSYHGGLQLIAEDEDAKSFRDDPKYKELEATYNLYLKALRLADDISLSPNFNISTSTWADFNSYKRAKLQERDAVKNSRYYKNISNISAVNSAINSLDSRLNSAYATFKSNLISSIKSAYNNTQKTEEKFNRLSSVYEKFEREFGYSGELLDLIIQYSRSLNRK